MWSALAALALVSGQQAAYPEREAHRPTPLPDRIILTWKADPATTQSVTWRTDVSVSKALGQIAEAQDGPKFAAPGGTREVAGTSQKLEADLGEAHYHSVTFEGLKPRTKYVYRVGDGVNWSEWIHFSTASDKPEPFQFIYFGDAQNEVRSMWSRVIREAYSDAPKARFMIHAGDLINRANRDAEWGEWHQAGGWLNAMVPSIPAAGNHEYERPAPGQPSVISRHWRPQFELPSNGVAGLEESNFYLDYQSVRVVVLNSNEHHEEQAKWLDELLSRPRPLWTIVTFHHPVFSAAKNRDNPRIRELWKPVFDKHRVDLVLQGHDHTYARGAYTNVPAGNSARTPSGTVYVVSVSGPKMYDLDREPWMARAAADTQLYQIIGIDGNRLRYEARTAKGTLYDAFALQKQGSRPNRLIDQKPKTPENTRPGGSGS